MIKPKFEDFDYGKGRKDLSWLQYAKALEEYVTFLEAQDPALRQPPVSGRSEQLVCEHPDEAIIRDKPTDYCLACNRNI